MDHSSRRLALGRRSPCRLWRGDPANRLGPKATLCIFNSDLSTCFDFFFFFLWRHKSDLITGKSRDLISRWTSSLQPATFCKRPVITLSARRDGRAALTRYLPDWLIAFNGYYKML